MMCFVHKGREMKIESLESHESVQAAQLLCRAFVDGPTVNYVLDDANKRPRRWRSTFKFEVDRGVHFGETYSYEDMKGVAVWLKPGAEDLTPWQLLRLGYWQMPFLFDYGGYRRVKNHLNVSEQMKNEIVPDDHWYLSVLGVNPEFQGQGIGSKLLQPVLSKSDSGGHPCYLETSYESNLRFYALHGFEVRGEVQVPGGGPTLWGLFRKPGQA
jgi:ribosomal protein S18 acetylase RimI-like enzyme